MQEWYSPGKVLKHYYPEHIIWVIRNVYPTHWPPKPEGQSYIDKPLGKRGRNIHASFEIPAGILGEAWLRLNICGERCGLDGQLVIARYVDGVLDERLEGISRLPIGQINYYIRRALKYVSGSNTRRRKRDYKEFCLHYRE